VLAPPKGADPIVTGLRLSERARRVSVKAGIPAGRVHVVRSAQELAAARPALEGGPVLLVRATRQIVAIQLVEPLRPGATGARRAVDADGSYAGAAQVDGNATTALLDALAADFEAGDATAAAPWEAVQVGDRARHPAGNRAEIRAADAWQFQLIHKPLDGFLPAHYQRPLARPFTRIFLRLPFTPNQITVISCLVSFVGCFLAGFASWDIHALGLGVVVFGVILDACDGEVARLRLQESKIGAYLDAVGDDIARLALILGMGFHVTANYPDWPGAWITAGTLAVTLTSMTLIYWYCLKVLGTFSNQDYEEALGVGNKVEVHGGKKSLGRIIGDAGTTMARRVFIDPALFILALLGLSWLGFAGLALGSVAGLAVILPTHFRLVREWRTARAAE